MQAIVLLIKTIEKGFFTSPPVSRISGMGQLKVFHFPKLLKH